MNVRLLTMVGFLLAAGHPQSSHKVGESEHRTGPHGLDSWTLDFPSPDDARESLSGTLVVARNGRIIRRFEGDPLIFQWVFVADGRQIAYETGPLHFSMDCVLADVRTGRRLAHFDCYHELPKGAPAWVKLLEKGR